jgi:hypothetical protein
MILSVSDVAIITRSARSTKERTRSEAYSLLSRCDARLKAAGRGELALAADVRLPLDAVVRAIWTVRKTALAQWKAAKAEQAAGWTEVETSTEDDLLADYDQLLHDQRMAEAYTLAEADAELV